MNYSEMVLKSNRLEGGTISIYLRADNFKQTDMPRHNSSSGYGSKIPTSYMVKLQNRWYRVYCAIWGNSGTTYIVRKGQKLIADFY